MKISIVLVYGQENVDTFEKSLSSQTKIYSKNGIAFYKLNESIYNVTKKVACISECSCKSKKEVLGTLKAYHKENFYYLYKNQFYYLYINKYDVLINLDYKDIKSFLSKSLKKFFKDVK